MSLLPPEIVAELRGSHQLGIFLRIASRPMPLRLWFGMNKIRAGIDAIDKQGQTYIGLGSLPDVPEMEMVLNGVADRAEFWISGIDPGHDAIRDIDDVDVEGRDVHLGITTLDRYFQPMSAIKPLIMGTASFILEKSDPVEAGQNPTVAIGISVGFGITTRARAAASLWSDAHQRALWAEYFPTPELQAANPPDRFCERTSDYERGVRETWPRL